MDITQATGLTETNLLVDMLKGLVIVDVGVINTYFPSTGRCNVAGFQLVNGVQTQYTNIELLREGGVGNAFMHDVTGALCLLFAPRSPATDLHSYELDDSAGSYPRSAIKCMAINVQGSTELSIGFMGDGSFQIGASTYTVLIERDAISYSDGVEQFTITADGCELLSKKATLHQRYQYEVRLLQSSNGYIAHRLNYTGDGALVVQHIQLTDMTDAEVDDPASFTKYAWTDTIAATGDRTYVLQDANEQQLLSVSAAATGDITITNQGGTTIAVGVDGTLTITAGGDVTLKSANIKLDGTLQVTGAVTMDDKLTVSKAFSAANGNLTADV